MKLKQTQPNKLIVEKRRCRNCDKPTLFESSILPGKTICDECEPKVRESKIWHDAHMKNKRSKQATKTRTTRGRRGSNQYAIKSHDRTWLTVLIVLVLGTLLLLMLNAMFTPRLDDTFLNRKAEASFISPLPTVLASAVVATPTPSGERQNSSDGEVADFIRRVHRKESSSGTNTNPDALHNRCKAQGKSNEYGYGGMALMICFDSHEEATARVARWYLEHRPGRTEAQTYCRYNIGGEHETCAYWEEVRAW